MCEAPSIVCVTDDDALAADITASLAASGFADVRRIAPDGPEGTDAQVFLVDTRTGDGFGSAWLRKHPPGPTSGCIAILSLSSPLSADTLAEMGVDDVVVWPCSEFNLTTRIRGCTARAALAEHGRIFARDAWKLVDVTAALVGSDDLLRSLYAICGILAEELHASRASVVLVRPQRDMGLVVASSDDADLHHLFIHLDDYPEILRVMHTREPLIVHNVRDSKVLETVLPHLETAQVAAVALFPIVENDQVLGVIFLRYPQANVVFRTRDMLLCQGVANAAAIALRNHEVVQKLRQKDAHIRDVESWAQSTVAALRPFEDLFQRSKDALVVLSDTGVVVFANPTAARLFGKTDDTLCGLPFVSLLPPGEHERFGQLIERAHDDPAPVDLTIATTDGLRTCSTSVSPLGDGAMTLLSLRDVTEERHNAMQLVAMQQRLAEVEKHTAVLQLAGAASHELNQPLTAIMGTIGLLRRKMEPVPPPIAAILHNLQTQAERMAAIIRKLSGLTRVHTTSYVGSTKIVDLNTDDQNTTTE